MEAVAAYFTLLIRWWAEIGLPPTRKDSRMRLRNAFKDRAALPPRSMMHRRAVFGTGEVVGESAATAPIDEPT